MHVVVNYATFVSTTLHVSMLADDDSSTDNWLQSQLAVCGRSVFWS